MYQKYDILNGQLILYDQTLTKFKIILDLMKTLEKNKLDGINIIDLGSAEGALSLKIYDYYPLVNLTLVNYFEPEIKCCEKIMDKVYSQYKNKIRIKQQNINEIKGEYEIVLAFSVFHHMISQNKSAERALNKLSSFVNKGYLIMEVPIGHDVLLAIWIKNNNNKLYDVLSTVDNFKNFVSTLYEIIDCKQIDYNNKDLNRYCFIMKKKINSGS